MIAKSKRQRPCIIRARQPVTGGQNRITFCFLPGSGRRKAGHLRQITAGWTRKGWDVEGVWVLDTPIDTRDGGELGWDVEKGVSEWGSNRGGATTL